MLAYLGLGTNLGDRLTLLQGAIAALGRLGQVERVSPFYETDPVGYLDQPDFLNAVVCLRTDLAPLELLDQTQSIELAFGRERSFPNAPRTLDIDLLYLDGQLLDEPRLIVPHPRVGERAFALVPLAEIAPDLIDPRSGQTIANLLDQLPDRGGVRPYPA